jgi:hypothetical protein
MNEEYDDLVKDSTISDRDIEELREIFKREYAKKKGWNPDNLTIEQVNEICSDPKWKTGNFLIKS